jgi:hypothetical protein
MSHRSCLRRIPVESRNDLVLLVVWGVCERVDIGGQACRRGCVFARDMVVHTNLLGRRFDGLLYEVDQIWRAQFAQGLEGL